MHLAESPHVKAFSMRKVLPPRDLLKRYPCDSHSLFLAACLAFIEKRGWGPTEVSRLLEHFSVNRGVQKKIAMGMAAIAHYWTHRATTSYVVEELISLASKEVSPATSKVVASLSIFLGKVALWQNINRMGISVDSCTRLAASCLMPNPGNFKVLTVFKKEFAFYSWGSAMNFTAVLHDALQRKRPNPRLNFAFFSDNGSKVIISFLDICRRTI